MRGLQLENLINGNKLKLKAEALRAGDDWGPCRHMVLHWCTRVGRGVGEEREQVQLGRVHQLSMGIQVFLVHENMSVFTTVLYKAAVFWGMFMSPARSSAVSFLMGLFLAGACE